MANYDDYLHACAERHYGGGRTVYRCSYCDEGISEGSEYYSTTDQQFCSIECLEYFYQIEIRIAEYEPPDCEEY